MNLSRTQITFVAIVLITASVAGCGPGPVTQKTGKDASTGVAEQGQEKAGRPELPSKATTRMVGAPTMARVLPPRQYREQGRDRFTDFTANPVKVTAEEPLSTFSIDVDTASYGFMRALLLQGVLPPKDSIRVEELVNYFPYEYAGPETPGEPFAVQAALVPTPWNKATQLLHVGIKGYELEAVERSRANLVFLIDTSGSMDHDNKLPLLLNSLRLLLGALEPEDTVAVVTYAGSAGTALEPTPVSDKAKILGVLEGLRAEGSTAGGEGLRQAYLLAESSRIDDGVNRVLLATDGDFNVGIADPQELESFIERKRDSGIFLSVLGFGRGNYNDDLVQRLAQRGNGHAAYIDTLNEARKVLVEEATSTLFPIARDVKIQLEFNPEKVSEYRLIGYETRLLQREDFTNDKVDAGELGAGHTVTTLYELTPADSGQRRVPPRRYQQEAATTGGDYQDEWGFLKIRYKLPGAATSVELSRPITTEDMFARDEAPQEALFATAVAGFGQLLRGGRYTGDYSYADVLTLAQGARGEDPFGYRAEFMNLVRLAPSAAPIESLR